MRVVTHKVEIGEMTAVGGLTRISVVNQIADSITGVLIVVVGTMGFTTAVNVWQKKDEGNLVTMNTTMMINMDPEVLS